MEKEKKLPTHIVSAAGIVLNEKSEILMVNTYDHGWTFPGGIVEEGESLIEGLKREIFEESGIEAEVGELFCVSSNTAKYPGYNGVKEIPTKVLLDFICRKTGGTEHISEENSETGWFAGEEAFRLIKNPALIERFRAYLEYGGRPTYLSYVSKPEFKLQLKTKF